MFPITDILFLYKNHPIIRASIFINGAAYVLAHSRAARRISQSEIAAPIYYSSILNPYHVSIVNPHHDSSTKNVKHKHAEMPIFLVKRGKPDKGKTEYTQDIRFLLPNWGALLDKPPKKANRPHSDPECARDALKTPPHTHAFCASMMPPDVFEL